MERYEHREQNNLARTEASAGPWLRGEERGEERREAGVCRDASAAANDFKVSREGHMCPACIASTAVMVAGAGSTGGILMACIGKFRKVFRASGLGLLQKTREKGEMIWQQAKRETRNTGKGISR